MRDAVVTVPICPLFLEPREGSELADEVLYGMVVTVLGEEKGWLRFRTRYRYEGFACPGALGEKDAIAWEAEARSVVIRSFADVLSEPSYRSSVLVTLPRGAVLVGGAAAGEDAAWRSVTLADGRKGFVRASALRPARNWNEEGEECTRRHLAEDALAYLGTQYRWGGKTPQGIDCSGLCSMTYLLNGLVIYRDASIREGFPVRPIAAEAARKGDLLFWPGHIGLYLGDGRYVHSTGKSGGVLENSLRPEDPDYRDDLAHSITAWGSVF